MLVQLLYFTYCIGVYILNIRYDIFAVSRCHIGNYMQDTDFQQSHPGDLLELQLNIQMALLFLINEKPLKVQLFKKHCCIYLFTVIDVQIFFNLQWFVDVFSQTPFRKGYDFVVLGKTKVLKSLKVHFCSRDFVVNWNHLYLRKDFRAVWWANLEAGMPSFKAGDTLFFAAPDRAALLVTLAPILFCDLMFCCICILKGDRKKNNNIKSISFSSGWEAFF